MPSSNNKISIDFPLRGEWRFLRPPGHHPFAFDFVRMDKKRKRYSRKNKILYFISNIPANNYYSWGQPVYAPVDGKILQIGTNWKDNMETNIWKTIKMWFNATYKFKPKEKNGKLDISPNVGNYIMIKTKESYIVFLAHLKNGSIKVKEGQIIKSRDIIGKIGNSGNSTAPHLHINLFDQMKNPLQAKVLPFVFNEYGELNDNKWKRYTLSTPKVKSFIQFCK